MGSFHQHTVPSHTQIRAPFRVASIEIDPGFQQTSLGTIRTAQLERFFEGLAGSASERLPELMGQNRQFGMAFVDHDHRLAATREACTALEHLLMPGGLAVFHDFNDARNVNEPAVYGVFNGVCEWLEHNTNFAYVGTVGCCGLVQRRAA
ncbi:class I SAM-dependent methyltransferase [Rhodoferax sp. AJA081-3]|nr:class I SAM-dependent methyltransferase [Rhodoferax sp. AJA081-3]